MHKHGVIDSEMNAQLMPKPKLIYPHPGAVGHAHILPNNHRKLLLSSFCQKLPAEPWVEIFRHPVGFVQLPALHQFNTLLVRIIWVAPLLFACWLYYFFYYAEFSVCGQRLSHEWIFNKLVHSSEAVLEYTSWLTRTKEPAKHEYLGKK